MASNSELLELLREILRTPGDVAARMILADALDEFTEDKRRPYIDYLRVAKGSWCLHESGYKFLLGWYGKDCEAMQVTTTSHIVLCTTCSKYGNLPLTANESTNWNWVCTKCAKVGADNGISTSKAAGIGSEPPPAGQWW